MYYFFGLFSTAGPEVSLYMKYLNFIRMNSLYIIINANQSIALIENTFFFNASNDSHTLMFARLYYTALIYSFPENSPGN